MAARDMTMKTIDRELSLLLQRVAGTDELEEDYRLSIHTRLEAAQTCLHWAALGIPWNFFTESFDGGEEE